MNLLSYQVQTGCTDGEQNHDISKCRVCFLAKIMTMMSSTTATNNDLDEQATRIRYEAAGQGHVFDHYDKIPSDHAKAVFLQQLNNLPVERIGGLYDQAKQEVASDVSNIQPFTGTIARSSDSVSTSNFWNIGLSAISFGKVAALVLAGGQGTRLGYAGPKGMYQIGLPSNKSLFQLMSERILKLKELAAATTSTTVDQSDNSVAIRNVVPFYIMTSPLNHDETVSYFQQMNYFGLGSENVYFFQQGMLPCLTKDGKIILESAHAIAMAPDGNGGLYPSLQLSGALNDMVQRGVQYLHAFSIDNALVKPADPAFIGYCIEQNADCGNKVVWKDNAHEAVGVVALRDRKPCIVEYSEITKEMAEQTNPLTGQLMYGAGNICNHFYTLDFIQNSILPNMGNLYHIANKKIPYYDPITNTTMTPDTNNGIKLETFIFDVFPFSQRMTIMDVDRSEEFAPVKNKSGSVSDTPESACAMTSKLAQCWIVNAGGQLTGDVSSICEIAPNTSYAGEGLEDIAHGKVINCPFSL
jgi:UDP-N-acetylglucosamine/UDP-N-acetylgalactosamine diphosphorylase